MWLTKTEHEAVFLCVAVCCWKAWRKMTHNAELYIFRLYPLRPSVCTQDVHFEAVLLHALVTHTHGFQENAHLSIT